VPPVIPLARRVQGIPHTRTNQQSGCAAEIITQRSDVYERRPPSTPAIQVRVRLAVPQRLSSSYRARWQIFLVQPPLLSRGGIYSSGTFIAYNSRMREWDQITGGFASEGRRFVTVHMLGVGWRRWRDTDHAAVHPSHALSDPLLTCWTPSIRTLPRTRPPSICRPRRSPPSPSSSCPPPRAACAPGRCVW